MRSSILIAVSALALLSACGQQQPAATDPTAALSEASGDSHGDHDHGGPIALSATPGGPMTAGQAVSLTLRLTDQQGRAVVAEDLKENHGHLLHVMVVDAGLEDYVHAHPTANADGTFSFSFTPRLDRPYRLWADFQLAAGAPDQDHAETNDHDHGDHGHEHAAQSVFASVDIPVGAGVIPPIAATQALSAEAGGLRFQLSLPGALRAGEPTQARLAVVRADGQPFTQLEPLMGAFAHVVGFNPGATSMMHVHPEGAEPTDAAARGGPVLTFTLEPEAAGPQRLFVQVKANGREITVPFMLVVAQ